MDEKTPERITMVWKKLKINKYPLTRYKVVTTDLFEHNEGSIIKVNHDTTWVKGGNKWVVKYFNRGSSGEWVIGRPKTRSEALKMARKAMKDRPRG